MVLELAPYDEELTVEFDTVFARWRAALVGSFETWGVAPDRGVVLADLVMSGFEGALILSRAARSPSLSGAPLSPLSTLSITTPPSAGRLLAPSAVPRGPLAPRDRDRGFSASRSGGQRRAGHEAAPDGFHLFETGEREEAGIRQPSGDGLPSHRSPSLRSRVEIHSSLVEMRRPAEPRGACDQNATKKRL